MAIARPLKALALAGATMLALAGCSGGTETEPGATDEVATVEITDNEGTKTVPSPPQSVVATDNRIFETLHDWDIVLKAAPRALMPDTNPYKTDESIVDLGNHREPKLEEVVAVNPDVIINGQRFTQHGEKLAEFAPDAVIITLDPRDGEPFDEELKRQVTVLGEIFDKKTEAEELAKEFDDAIARAKAAYNTDDTVMAVNVSGGNIGYIAPGQGRTLGPVFDFLGMTPALEEVEGASANHQGDDISVEAIAQSNPDWILVMDRDAAAGADDAAPASQIIDSSEALKGVTAVQEGNVIYMPADTYTNEGIQTYTEFLNSFAEALEHKN